MSSTKSALITLHVGAFLMAATGLFSQIINLLAWDITGYRTWIAAGVLFACMQPVYGVIYGVIFLHSIPDVSTFVGRAIIVTAAIFESLREHNKAALALTD